MSIRASESPRDGYNGGVADPLRGYRSKRDFGATPEPAGGASDGETGNAPRFVIQEHDATRLHWDLRLERDGVLVSWALPRYIPGSSGDNRIAVRTEDHPIDYLAFEGEIPEGEYGAGTMRIHDSGTYEPLKWEARKVEVDLHGERVRGRYALFPLAPAGEPAGKDWMIHRMGAPADPDAQPMPDFVAPMLARPGEVPEGDDWAFEVKWDGIRAQARSEPGRMTLSARSGGDITARYPELARMNRALHEHSAVLDGEIVAFDAQGRPSFQALQRRMHVENAARVRKLAGEVPVTYVVFDLLWLDGRSLMGLPYSDRRELLSALDLDGDHWQTPEPHDEGAALLTAAASLGLEGIVAKRRSAPYEPGRRSSAWVKVKQGHTADLFIGGWVEGEGGRSGGIGALLVGEPGADGLLRYAGRVGTGFSERALDDLAARLQPLAADRSPFAATARGSGPPSGSHWVSPELVGEVRFTEHPEGGLLRHPVWLGLRDDGPTRLVLVEERNVRGRGATATALIGGRRVAVTNLEKVLFPEAGFSKRQVIDYYAAVAWTLLPHLAGRALTLKRYPDGVEGEAFFEKRAPSHRPGWAKTQAVTLGRETIDFVLADEPATLVWLAQLAALELHPSLALAKTADRPTAVVFDLDPGAPATIVECCQVARLLRGMLDGLGLDSLAKTSGSKGLQVYMPLNRPDATFEASKTFARAVADLLAREEPALAVSTQAKTARRGKVLIDWAQNDRAKTTVAVYSLRGRDRPTVSTPVTWEEVEACLASGDAEQLVFTAGQVRERIAEHGDLFAEVLTLSQPLPAA